MFFYVGQIFTPEMRMLVYNQLNGHTSSGKMKDVLRVNAQLLGIKLEERDIPTRSSLERMQIELGILSDLQVADFIYKNCGLTLGFDATTQLGVHVNAINIHNNQREYVLAIDELPGISLFIL